MKSKTYHHEAGFYARNAKQKKITNNIDELSASTLSHRSSASNIEYTKHRLEHFVHKQSVYGKKKLARLRFQKYSRTSAVMHRLAKEVVGRVQSRALVVFGSSKVAANSPIRGYLRAPQPKLLQAIKNLPNVDVLEFDEFRTTKLCSNCFFPVLTSDSPHRYQFCPKCGKHYNSIL